MTKGDELLAWRGRFKALVGEDRPDSAGNAVLQLIAALQPFAEFDVPLACGTRDDSTFYAVDITGHRRELTVGDFRRARAAIAKATTP